MGDARDDGVVTGRRENGPRALVRVAEPIPGISYYPREIDYSSYGYRGWWHAYFGYRSAPMGAVTAGTVVATFYNFAPRMVAQAVPDVWSIQSPADTVAMRLERVEQAMGRIFGPESAGGRPNTTEMARAALLLRRGLDDLSGAGRPLFAAYAQLDWPDDDLTALWHGSTLLRELRGDGHNVALAAAEVDGVSSHVLMAGRGFGNKPTILSIRGWTEAEWDDAVRRLGDRGWVDDGGALTELGRGARSEIERHTDALSTGPVAKLGVDGLQELLGYLDPLADYLKATGEVPGRWPPKHLDRLRADNP